MLNYPITVVAFDPGVTTGHAVGTIAHPGAIMKVRTGQNRFDHLDLWLQLELLKPTYVVAEGFEYRNRSRRGLVLYPVELLGVLHLWCSLNKQNLYVQKAQEGKSYFSDTLLKGAKLWAPGKPHSMDALRHLLHWYTFGYGYQYNVSGYEKS